MPAKFTKTKIAYCGWSWNPIAGCLHECWYCYARGMARRFKEKFNSFKPTFYEERLRAPYNTKIPRTASTRDGLVFVSSMGDMFGDWVERDWIESVLNVIRDTPRWTYLLCTKNPKRLAHFDFPPNAWVGATVDEQKRVEPTEEALERVDAPVRFLQCEPLLEKLTFRRWDLWQWLVIGPLTGAGKRQPQHEWVRILLDEAAKHGCKVFMKPTLQIDGIPLVQEYP